MVSHPVGQRTGRSEWRTEEKRSDKELPSATENLDMTLRENAAKAAVVAAAPSTTIIQLHVARFFFVCVMMVCVFL